MFTKDFEEISSVTYSYLTNETPIRENNFKVLEVNPYEYLRNVSSEAKNQILYNERYFSRA